MEASVQYHASAALPQRKDAALNKRMNWVLEPVWMFWRSDMSETAAGNRTTISRSSIPQLSSYTDRLNDPGNHTDIVHRLYFDRALDATRQYGVDLVGILTYMSGDKIRVLVIRFLMVKCIKILRSTLWYEHVACVCVVEESVVSCRCSEF